MARHVVILCGQLITFIVKILVVVLTCFMAMNAATYWRQFSCGREHDHRLASFATLVSLLTGLVVGVYQGVLDLHCMFDEPLGPNALEV
jgi:flagellar biosynthesis protein FliQ